MSIRTRSSSTLGFFLCSFGIAVAQEVIENWPAPAVWSQPGFVASKGEVSPSEVEGVEAVPTSPLHFVGITPCRLADTRGNGFAGQYGPPALTPVGRNMVIAGQCGIPGEAQAVSFNFSAVNVPAAGFFVAYPAGGAFPAVATMTYNQNTPNLSNAAVVPLGAGGAITVVAAVTTINLVVDVNGYYRPGVVTGLSGLSGNVTLAAGSNVTIAPSGQTLTVASTGGPGGVLPTGTSGQTLRHNGTAWVASDLLKNFETGLQLNGNLTFPSLVSISLNGYGFLHNAGSLTNTLLGTSSGGAGLNNTGVGAFVLGASSSGGSNTAVGASALGGISSGSGNIAIGRYAGTNISTGSNNIYIGNNGVSDESNQIRIGDASLQNGVVIAGIAGGVITGSPVLVTGGGRLGVAASSLRFKDDIQDVADRSDGVMKLRPVAFKYKSDIDPSGTIQYGLIAEEVAEIYPELVVNDDEGRPLAIRSQLLEPLLLNEVQKQRRSIEAQRIEIETLKAELAKLGARLEGRSEP